MKPKCSYQLYVHCSYSSSVPVIATHSHYAAAVLLRILSLGSILPL